MLIDMFLKIWLGLSVSLFPMKYCCGQALDNLDLKQKQMFVFKLLNHIIEPTIYEDVLNISTQFQIEEHVDLFTQTEHIKDFIRSFRSGLLPRGEVFCLFCDKHLEQAIQTFQVLYYAKDFETFLKTSSWMRLNINEGLFIYSFSVAVRHRDDCRSIILPPIYEIYPHLFVTYSTIQKAAMVKMKMDILDVDLSLQYGITKPNKTLIEILDNLDFTYSQEDRLSYFTRDIGLNTYYYNFHIDYPFWMGDEIFGLSVDRRGELYIYMHRQLSARYYLERLSNNLCETETLDASYKIEVGYNPATTFHTGWSLPERPRNTKLSKEQNRILKEVLQFEHRLRDAVTNGFILSFDGAKMDMRRSDGIEILGRRLYGNLDKSDRDLSYYYELLTRQLLSTNVQNYMGIQLPTSSLQFYERALSDPVFWQLQRNILDFVDRFEHTRRPHRRDDLFFAGVKITGISVGKLITYFENVTFDITNALPLNTAEVRNRAEALKIAAKTLRLNHAPFSVSLDVQSDKACLCVVRMFLGPKEDCNGNVVDVEINRNNFLELDMFVQTLTIGNNTILRHSRSLNNVIETRDTTDNLWNVFQSSGVINVTSYLQRQGGFPANLILPKGGKGGRIFTLFVIISPFEKQRTYSGFSTEEVRAKNLCRFNLCVHSAPLGFPFNKEVNLETLTLPNTRFVDVIIFLKEKKDILDDLLVV